MSFYRKSFAATINLYRVFPITQKNLHNFFYLTNPSTPLGLARCYANLCFFVFVLVPILFKLFSLFHYSLTLIFQFLFVLKHHLSCTPVSLCFFFGNSFLTLFLSFYHVNSLLSWEYFCFFLIFWLLLCTFTTSFITSRS